MSVLKSVYGKSYGADRTILIHQYKTLIRPILNYASLILDKPENGLEELNESAQNAQLCVANGAL